MPKASIATPDEIDGFLNFVDLGFSVEQAAKRVGRSRRWGFDTVRRVNGKNPLTPGQRGVRNAKLPDPKTYDELDGGVKDTLKDFNLFCQKFLNRDPSPWREDAALRTVERLLDHSRRDFQIVNCPPGSGKTTLFTFDIPLWLICGGGAEDPAWGRAMRILLGSATKNVATHYVKFLRDVLDRRRPFYDKDRAMRGEEPEAELVPALEFGRFRPVASLGEDTLWEKNQFTVAQMAHLDIYDKEPTVQAASKESGFLGERVRYSSWDDLSVGKNSRTAEQQAEMSRFSRNEAESRTEPGGLFNIVGQRLGPLDLFNDRLKDSYVDHEGTEKRKFEHIVYPAHIEHLCPNEGQLGPGCIQWDGDETGCLLDEKRLPWQDLQANASDPDYRTVYQQEDVNPDDVLVLPAWIEGGTDQHGFEAPGCWDRERGFLEWPEGFTYDYVCVDPSASRYWAVEWWAFDPKSECNYLIYGERRKMSAGGSEGFLDFDPTLGKHVGVMEELQEMSGRLGHPIRMWVVEQNAAHRYLFQTNAFRTWSARWKNVKVISHQTQKNKNDMDFGVEASLKMPYRNGLKRLPRRKARSSDDHNALKALNFTRHKVHELTTFPFANTDDTVMADWFGEMRRSYIKDQANQVAQWDFQESTFDDVPLYLLEDVT